MVAGAILVAPGALVWPAWTVHTLMPSVLAGGSPGGWHVTMLGSWVVPWPVDWIPWGFALGALLGVALLVLGASTRGEPDSALLLTIGAVRAATGVALLTGSTLVVQLAVNLLQAVGAPSFALAFQLDVWIWGALGLFGIVHGGLLMAAGRGRAWRAAALVVGLASVPTGWVLAVMHVRSARRAT